MGYYTIHILPESCDLKTIITGFGKFRYNRVPIGLCAFYDIFQAKVDELLSNIKGFKTYIDDILVLGKGIFSQHIYQLIVIFSRIHNKVIKVSSHKCSFGLK